MYDKFLHKMAPASALAGLWAFLVRASSPMALPKTESLGLMENYPRIDELIGQIKRVAISSELMDFPTYVRGQVRRKRAAYFEGMKRFKEKPHIPSRMDIVVKPDEKQHHQGGELGVRNDKYKPRNIYNPSEQVKGVGGWVMYNTMQCLKKTEMLGTNFASGSTPEALEAKILQAYRRMKRPVFISWDGTRHDSLQHQWFLEHVDNKLLRGVIPTIAKLSGFNATETEAILSNLTILKTPVRMMEKSNVYKGKNKLKILLKAEVHGTVYSGHPSKTTFGNGSRVLLLSHKACDNVKIVWNEDLVHFQIGDDTLIVAEEDIAVIYEPEIKRLYEEYGLLMQDFKVSSSFEFLSREGRFEFGRIQMTRFCERLVQTGTYSVKMAEKDMEGFDKAITSQMEPYSEMVGGKEYLEWRKSSEKNVKISSRVKDLMDDVHKTIMDGSDKLLQEPTPNVSKDYKILAACGGNPERLWLMHA